METNIITLTDSYKIGHWNMYPKGTERVYSYYESRKGAVYNNTVFFGLQYLIKKYLEGRVISLDTINKSKKLIDSHLGTGAFNYEGWIHILKKHNGKLPLLIKAVPEGTPIPTNNVLMTIENTDDKCYWLTNYVETLLTHVWSASTVASLSREIKIMCKHYLEKTSDNMDGLSFMLHDFGFRGVSSVESAGFEGAGHLINFMGTDTIRAIEFAMEYYGSDTCAFSVPATEHSIMISMGEEGEYNILDNLLKKYPTGILSIVIDSYDYKRFILHYSKILKNDILKRNGKVVFRPDSGEPVTTTIHVLEMLDLIFGSSKNSKGYKVLNPKIGMLWGDGIDYMGIRNILHAMKEEKWSAENIVFGMGGGLLQKINRDTQRFAFKSSAQCRNGKWYDVYKKPLDISKISKKGKQYLCKIEETKGNYKYITSNNKHIYGMYDILIPVFENGKLLKEYSFDEVRKRAII